MGVTLYESLTLRKPFDAPTTQEVVSRIQTDEPDNPKKSNPWLPADLATIVLKALEKSPQRRYADAAALASDLRAFLAFRPIAARAATPITRLVKLTRRNPKIAIGLGSGTAAAAIAAFVWWLQPGYVTFTSPTLGATVFVDGAARGRTPLDELALAPGPHRVRFESGTDLFTPEEEILVSRGRVKPIERALTSRNGVLELHSKPPGARVTLRGASGAETPIPDTTPTRFDVLGGRYEAHFSLAGFPERVEPVEIPAGASAFRWEPSGRSAASRSRRAARGARGDLCGGRRQEWRYQEW